MSALEPQVWPLCQARGRARVYAPGMPAALSWLEPTDPSGSRIAERETLMNIENYGRQLLDVLAERSLQVLRSTKMDDVRRMVRGEVPDTLRAAIRPDHSALSAVGAALGIFAVGAAVGAGITALTTPSSGPELRRQLQRGARDATKQVRKEAKILRADVAHRLDDAKNTVAETLSNGVEHVTTAVGLTSPAPTKKPRARARKTMNGHAPAHAKKAASRRAAHA